MTRDVNAGVSKRRAYLATISRKSAAEHRQNRRPERQQQARELDVRWHERHDEGDAEAEWVAEDPAAGVFEEEELVTEIVTDEQNRPVEVAKLRPPPR